MSITLRDAVRRILEEDDIRIKLELRAKEDEDKFIRGTIMEAEREIVELQVEIETMREKIRDKEQLIANLRAKKKALLEKGA